MSSYDDKLTKYRQQSVDDYLGNISEPVRDRLWKLVSALWVSYENRGRIYFPIPYEKIKLAGLLNEDAREILSSLHEKCFIGVSYTPTTGKIQTLSITSNPEIYNHTQTRIRIKNHFYLTYLYKKLKAAYQNKPNIEKTIKSNEEKEQIVFSIPKNKTLKDATIKFLQDDEFEISIGDKVERHHGSELGLLKTNRGKFTGKEILKFLLLLSMNNGVLPLKNYSQSERDEKTTRKKELKKTLMKIFGTKEDPFFKYNKEADVHKIKIKLVPPTSLRNNNFRDRKINDPYADYNQFFNDAIS